MEDDEHASAELEGDSSEEDSDKPSDAKARGMCGQWVWPCPREFPADVERRKAMKVLIPEDLDKSQVGEKFKKALSQHGKLASLERLHIFSEPHRKYHRGSGRRARHFHVIFRFRDSFAHARIGATLRGWGLHGHFWRQIAL